MKKIKCEKHGFLNAGEKVGWVSLHKERWCFYCVNEMMNKFCGELVEVEDEEEKV
jgi:hypothetical protein